MNRGRERNLITGSFDYWMINVWKMRIKFRNVKRMPERVGEANYVAVHDDLAWREKSRSRDLRIACLFEATLLFSRRQVHVVHGA